MQLRVDTGSNQNTRVLYAVLQILADADEPIGAGQLQNLLLLRGFRVSQATVGRILSTCDRVGWSSRSGFEGRVLTSKGRAELQRYRAERQRILSGMELVECTRVMGKERLVHLLGARRAVEAETARLAAQRVDGAVIWEMRSVISRARARIEDGLSGLDEGSEFHRQVALASGNPVLVAMYDLLRTNREPAAVIIVSIQAISGQFGLSEHEAIVDALSERDGDKASRLMVEHIDNVIRNVEQYWSQVAAGLEGVLKPADSLVKEAIEGCSRRMPGR